jgi:glycerophosphoryl diester phosphodiesterase
MDQENAAAEAMAPVVAHRGASATAPENTLAAFREAARQGAGWIEFDVRLARCGTPVVLHDASLNRTSNRRGRVATRALAELADVDMGGWFGPSFHGEPLPTLESALGLAAALGMGCNVELKAETAVAAKRTARAAAPLLVAAPCPVLASSFAEAALEALRAEAPTLGLGLLVGRRVATRHLAVAKALAARSLHADHRAYGAHTAARCREHGLWPVAYTVNDVARAVRLHRQLGVGSIITDHPAAILAAIGP